MTKQELDKLEQQLCDFADRLSPNDRLLFQSIMNKLSQGFYAMAEVMKMADIHCIPSKVQSSKDGFYGKAIDDGTRIDPLTVLPTFTPAKKTKGDPLAELAASLEPHERQKLIEKLK